MPTRITAAVSIPMKLPSIANTRMHWTKMDRLKKQQKLAVRTALFYKRFPPLPVIVTMTRIGPRKLDDDNLAAAFKYVRDSIAHYYSIDDGSPLYTWVCEQRVSKGYGIEIRIEERQ